MRYLTSKKGLAGLRRTSNTLATPAKTETNLSNDLEEPFAVTEAGLTEYGITLTNYFRGEAARKTQVARRLHAGCMISTHIEMAGVAALMGSCARRLHDPDAHGDRCCR